MFLNVMDNCVDEIVSGSASYLYRYLLVIKLDRENVDEAAETLHQVMVLSLRIVLIGAEHLLDL